MMQKLWYEFSINVFLWCCLMIFTREKCYILKHLKITSLLKNLICKIFLFSFSLPALESHLNLSRTSVAALWKCTLSLALQSSDQVMLPRVMLLWQIIHRCQLIEESKSFVLCQGNFSSTFQSCGLSLLKQKNDDTSDLFRQHCQT